MSEIKLPLQRHSVEDIEGTLFMAVDAAEVLQLEAAYKALEAENTALKSCLRKAGWHDRPDWDFARNGPGCEELDGCACAFKGMRK